MKRLLLISILAGIMLATPTKAEIVTYEDEYFSFEYDDESMMKITRTCSDGSTPLLYIASTQMLTEDDASSLMVYVYVIDENGLQAKKTQEGFVTISEDPLEQYSLRDDATVYRKILALDGNYIADIQAFFPIAVAEEKDPIRTIYDSFTVNGVFSEDTFASFEWESTTIFSNVIYSEQGLQYIGQAINICDSYLSASISGDEAEKRMKSIIAALEDLKENGDYCYDTDLYHAVWLKESRFSHNDDAGVIDLKAELEKFLPDESK